MGYKSENQLTVYNMIFTCNLKLRIKESLQIFKSNSETRDYYIRKVVISANKELGGVVYYLDIYGQLDSNQTEQFTKLQKIFPDYINYFSLVKFDESVDILKFYFALLFPTYYEGEGFAGIAIDAYSAGTPVLASNWKYNNEVVKDSINGGLVEPKNVERLTIYLIKIANNPEQWLNMRQQCVCDVHTYEPDNVMKTLLQEII